VTQCRHLRDPFGCIAVHPCTAPALNLALLVPPSLTRSAGKKKHPRKKSRRAFPPLNGKKTDRRIGDFLPARNRRVPVRRLHGRGWKADTATGNHLILNSANPVLVDAIRRQAWWLRGA
jgi:hypothetical protein